LRCQGYVPLPPAVRFRCQGRPLPPAMSLRCQGRPLLPAGRFRCRDARGSAVGGAFPLSGECGTVFVEGCVTLLPTVRGCAVEGAGSQLSAAGSQWPPGYLLRYPVRPRLPSRRDDGRLTRRTLPARPACPVSRIGRRRSSGVDGPSGSFFGTRWHPESTGYAARPRWRRRPLTSPPLRPPELPGLSVAGVRGFPRARLRGPTAARARRARRSLAAYPARCREHGPCPGGWMWMNGLCPGNVY
jgi:hypothetical protein